MAKKRYEGFFQVFFVKVFKGFFVQKRWHNTYTKTLHIQQQKRSHLAPLGGRFFLGFDPQATQMSPNGYARRRNAGESVIS